MVERQTTGISTWISEFLLFIEDQEPSAPANNFYNYNRQGFRRADRETSDVVKTCSLSGDVFLHFSLRCTAIVNLYLQLGDLWWNVPHQTLAEELHSVGAQQLRQWTHLCNNANAKVTTNKDKKEKNQTLQKDGEQWVSAPEMSEYSSALKVSSFSVGRLTKAFMAGK